MSDKNDKKFNLKNYVKVDPDEHISSRLERDRGNIPNEVNEAQLESQRSGVDEVLVEKLLDNSRNKSKVKEANRLPEARLDDEKGDFDIVYRNPSAYTGDINKLEEKRLKNNPAELVKPEDASVTPKDSRWWENAKSPDGLKLASKIKKSASDYEKFLSEKDFMDEDEITLDQLLDADKEKENEDFQINDISELQAKEDAQEEAEREDKGIVEKQEGVKITKRKDITKPIPGIYMAFDFDNKKYRSPMEAKTAILREILRVRPELAGLVSVDDIYDVNVEGMNGVAKLRLVGDEYAGIVGADKDPASLRDQSKKDAAKDMALEEGSFEENDYSEEDIDGTLMASGSVKVLVEVEEDTKYSVVKGAIKYLKRLHPELEIDEYSVNLSNLMNSGEISYMAPVVEGSSLPKDDDDFNIEEKAIDTPEEFEEMKADDGPFSADKFVEDTIKKEEDEAGGPDKRWGWDLDPNPPDDDE